jgi:DNA-binding NtrC family response regulator
MMSSRDLTLDDLAHARLLVVDDEEMITSSIRNNLELETDWEVVTQTSPLGAVEVLKKQQVDLIISDYVMPEMNGIDFLVQARRLQPAATRILLTGYTDKENAIRAINEAGIFQYIEKPWDNEEMRLIIRNGLEKRFLLRKLEEKIRALEGAKADLEDVHQAILKAFI